ALVGGGKSTPSGHIPFTPPAKKVLELSLREALALKKEYIGTEHILLGLVHEGHGVGAQILVTAAPLPAVRAGLRLPPEAVASVRAQVVSEFRETLASIGETLAALEHRLTGIER